MSQPRAMKMTETPRDLKNNNKINERQGQKEKHRENLRETEEEIIALGRQELRIIVLISLVYIKKEWVHLKGGF